jgi:hypothetical protein
LRKPSSIVDIGIVSAQTALGGVLPDVVQAFRLGQLNRFGFEGIARV